jgi:hypothetical protein
VGEIEGYRKGRGERWREGRGKERDKRGEGERDKGGIRIGKERVERGRMGR